MNDFSPEPARARARALLQRDRASRRATASAAPATAAVIGVDDFYAYLPMHHYIFVPTRELWPAASVNGRLADVALPDASGRGRRRRSVKPADWLDQHRPVEQMTWAPGAPMIIDGQVMADGGWMAHAGCRTFNLYRPPTPLYGDPHQAGPWVAHLERIYPDDARHIEAWLAHRVQRPGEKINHALVLGGAQGIGKDTLLEPVRDAIGPWNFLDISPLHLLAPFNGFAKAVVLRVSEARDLGDVDRFAFYDHMKIYAAAPPAVLRVNEKHVKEVAVANVCGVVITTNHRSDGLFLPPDDRRHYIAWSDCTREAFTADDWTTLWQWYATGGIGHVAAYLAALPLDQFDPKAPPRKTPAFWTIVDAYRTSEDAELADVIESLDTPTVTLEDLIERAGSDQAFDFQTWLKDRRNRRQIPHRLDAVGYTPVRNPYATDGLWKVAKRRRVLYAPSHWTERQRLEAAQERCREQ